MCFQLHCIVLLPPSSASVVQARVLRRAEKVCMERQPLSGLATLFLTVLVIPNEDTGTFDATGKHSPLNKSLKQHFTPLVVGQSS